MDEPATVVNEVKAGNEAWRGSLVRQLAELARLSGRRQLARLAVLMTATALMELVGIGSIVALAAALVDPGILASSRVLGRLQSLTGATDARQFTMLLGLACFAALVAINALTFTVTWMIYTFTWQQGHHIALRLLEAYLARSYATFLSRNTSDMLENLFVEVPRVVSGVLVPALTLVSRGLAAAAILALLVWADWRIAIIAGVILGGTYAVSLAVLRPVLARIGESASVERKAAHLAASEALGGIKDVRLQARERFMLDRFRAPSRAANYHEGINQVLAIAPRYLLEVLAFGGMMLIVVAMIRQRYDTAAIAPLLATYAFAGYRLMPAMQQIYFSLAHLRYNHATLDRVLRDIADSPPLPPPARPVPADLFADARITLQGVSFAYPGAARPVLDAIDLEIAPNTSIAVIGRTGAGKTTLIDIVLGLLEPTAGKVSIDGVPLQADNVRAWQSRIGYVPHTLYLTDDTIAANIAFGVPRHEIDMARVRKAAQTAKLAEFVERELPAGYETSVGERGARLSSGQRQRIGIARALYREPRLLVLDEATSALDYQTEAAVMDAIGVLSGKVTIIMIAHRLHTIQACDAVYEIVDGRLAPAASLPVAG